MKIAERVRGFFSTWFLLELMQRIPSQWAWAAEPPQVFRADE